MCTEGVAFLAISGYDGVQKEGISMKHYPARRSKRANRRTTLLLLCLLVVVTAAAVGIGLLPELARPADGGTEIFPSPSSAVSQPAPEPEPEPIRESTATIVSTGDIMLHSPQLEGAYVPETGEYDFSAFFPKVAPYFQEADLAVGNLEVTFGGPESGAYTGYPCFNAPDSLADTIKEAGIGLLLTSNNHSVDTRLFGLQRTARVLREKGIDFIGTREDTSTPLYTVKEINDIRIGMANYGYETEGSKPGRKYFNGILLAEEGNDLISSFSYHRLDAFYADAEAVIADMKSQGAEFIVFYLHWGDEYRTTPNSWQKTIAQELTNLGVDLIIGSHPHVVQPIEMLQAQDGTHSTICLYSSGNAISNQRQERMDSCPTGHTEDGTLFYYTLHKVGDEVTLTAVDLIPTWVNRYTGGNGYQYTIYPMEQPDWGATKYGMDATAAAKAAKSYARTKEIVSEGLTACQQALGCEVTFEKEE